ncbi:hypothetical protein K3495_g3802 [Podosphaera aphanis]|nr:hypothetical protein K3495_g3802 [Podosphaera aphanis]
MLHLPSPAVWVTDRDIALMRAIQSLHPSTSIVLCVWHINMDVRGYASKLLKQKELVNDLVKDWENVVYSNTAIKYMDNWKKFEDRYTLSDTPSATVWIRSKGESNCCCGKTKLNNQRTITSTPMTLRAKRGM